MDLADTLGFYRREGLAVDLVRVQNTPLAIVALKTGNADLANISLSGALKLAAQCVMKIKAILSPDKSIRYLIASHGDVPSIKALEGRTLGIGGVGSLDHSMSRLVLAAHGVDVEKVKVVAFGEPHVRALSLSARRIDATTMSVGIWNRFRDRPGLKVLLSDEDYFNAAPVLNKVIVADQDFLAARRPAVERFVAALVVSRIRIDLRLHAMRNRRNSEGFAASAQMNCSTAAQLGLVLSRLGSIEGLDEPAR